MLCTTVKIRVKYWSTDNNKQGFCSAPSCIRLQLPGNVKHILQECGALADIRAKMLVYFQECSYKFPFISQILTEYGHPGSIDFVQFVLDCSGLSLVIQTYQTHGRYILDSLFKITRTFCFAIHRAYKIIRTQNSIL